MLAARPHLSSAKIVLLAVALHFISTLLRRNTVRLPKCDDRLISVIPQRKKKECEVGGVFS
jgi:hypothetical protein